MAEHLAGGRSASESHAQRPRSPRRGRWTDMHRIRWQCGPCWQSWSLDGVFVDMSKQKWDAEVLEGLLDLAREADVA